jgi:hypothetical protein
MQSSVDFLTLPSVEATSANALGLDLVVVRTYTTNAHFVYIFNLFAQILRTIDTVYVPYLHFH